VSLLQPGSFAEVKRQAAIDHVLAAARRLVRTKGDVTMDELAGCSGASRRTLFRHFTTRDKLLAAAFGAGIIDYRQQLPAYDGEPDSGLRAMCDTPDRMNATVGPGFFELASRRDLSPDLATVAAKRVREFRAAMTDISQTLWRATGRDDRPPQLLHATVCAHLSSSKPTLHRGPHD
jgi:AcrR family transcriptional regulator